MEVYEASEYFIVHEGDHSLWCNRTTGIIEAKPGMILFLWWFENLLTVSDSDSHWPFDVTKYTTCMYGLVSFMVIIAWVEICCGEFLFDVIWSFSGLGRFFFNSQKKRFSNT